MLLHPVKICSYNNFTLYSSGLSIFLRETGSVSQLPTSTKLLSEGENYFSGNTRLRSSFLLPLWGFGELTNNRFALQGEIHIPVLCPPHLVHAYTQVGVCRCRMDARLERIAYTRRKSLACGKVMLHHGIHRGWTAALPKSHSTLRTLRSVMVVVLSSLVYTAKVTDHHGSDFSSRTPPRCRSGAVLEWSIDFVECAYEQTY